MVKTVSSNKLEDSLKISWVAGIILPWLVSACTHPHHKFLSQVPVWAVLDYTDTKLISRELLLVKVSILGSEYLEDQLTGGPSLSPRTERWSSATHSPSDSETEDSKTALAQSFEHSGQPSQAAYPIGSVISPSELLRRKHQHLQSIATLAREFKGNLVDISDNSVIVELTGKSSRVDAFLKLVQPFGVLESARTGAIFSFTFFLRYTLLRTIIHHLS